MSEEPSCLDCKMLYIDMGIDLALPDQVWEILVPEGGILCANCICKRLGNYKATALLAWPNNFDYPYNPFRR